MCEFDLGPSVNVLGHFTLTYDGEHLSQVILIKLLQLMKELWTRQAILSHLDLELWPSQMVVVHYITHYGNARAYQVSIHSNVRWQSYALDIATLSLLTTHRPIKMSVCVKFIKFLRLKKGLWTGQAVLSQLTLNCDLPLGPSHTVLAHSTLSLDG